MNRPVRGTLGAGASTLRNADQSNTLRTAQDQQQGLPPALASRYNPYVQAPRLWASLRRSGVWVEKNSFGGWAWPAENVFLLEPQRTAYDLNFSVAGIPARVHPLFWLCTAILGQKLPTYLILNWIAVAFFSILVHELGHALAARACGWRPHVVLYAMGGLAIYRPTYHSPYRQVGISLAGPGAGFVLAAITALFVILSGHRTGEIVPGFSVGWRGNMFDNEQMRNLVYFLMQVNLIWGCVNLLPIFPLDGGQIARELWSMQDPISGMRKTLVLSIVVSVIGAAIAWFLVEDKFLAIFFTVFAVTSYLNLRQVTSGGFGQGMGGEHYEGGPGGGGGFDDGYEDSRGGRGW